MNCHDARLCISRQLDGELSEEEGKLLVAHLGGCDACARFAETCRLIQRGVRELPRPGTSERYHDVLTRRLDDAMVEELSRRGVGRPRLWRALAVLSLSVAALLVAALVVQQVRIARQARGMTAVPAAEGYDLHAMSRQVSSSSPTSLAEQAAAFRTLAQYYQGGLKWLAQDGREAELGVSNVLELPAATEGQSRITFELRLLRVSSDGQAQLVSSPTVMMLLGEEARFDMKDKLGGNGLSFRYRCLAERSPDDRARLTVELEVSRERGGRVAQLYGSSELSRGQETALALSRASDGGFVLFLLAPEVPSFKGGT